jgi:hydrogenase expression/formation protein HypD
MDHPESRVIFLGIGFETTASTVAASLLEARDRKIGNYLIYSAHKRIPPVLTSLALSPDLSLDGFLCPPHVSSTIGTRFYDFLVGEEKMACVVSGFEPLDILQGIWMVLRQLLEGVALVEVQYRRAVRDEGNTDALAVLDEVFEVVPSPWRGLGLIPDSGFRLREEMRSWDALHSFPLPSIDLPEEEEEDCLCGDILKGIRFPPECPSFGLTCTPHTPHGPCMVSGEGTCAAYYRYET